MAIRKPDPSNTEYNRKPVVRNGEGERAIETARQRYAKHKDKPTTAAADPSLRLPEALRQVDPQAISQVLPQMYSKLMMVRNLMNSFNSRNGNSTTNNTSPEGYAKTSIIDIFSGALAILVKEHGYYEVLEELFDVMANDQYKNIYEDYQEIVFEAIVNLIKEADENGETNIPISTIPEVTYGTGVPTPLYASYTDVPNYYIQQYYATELDPYPGYIEYLGPDEDSIYVRRRTIDYPFESAEDEIFIKAEYDMAEELSPYIEDTNLTIDILNELLVEYCTQVIIDISEKNNGKNSNDNLLSLLSTLAGIAGQMATNTKTNHLPQSVLNVASMTTTLENHMKNIGKIKKLKQHSQTAFNPLQSLSTSGLLSSLQSMMKSKQISPQQVVQMVIQRVTT
jgi:hypothetical protein